MTDLNHDSFRELIASEIPTVVDFWAAWCMPCKIFAPVVEEISDEMDGKANFGKVDVDEENALAIEYGVASIPTLVIFKNGEEKARLVGVRQKDEIVKLIESFM